MTTPDTTFRRADKGGPRTVMLSPKGTPQSLLLRKAKLLIVNGAEQGREVVIDKDVFRIGAGPQNDLIVQDEAASRLHCEIQQREEGFLLRDLGSTNGTTVQGVRVCEVYLTEGVEFQVGTTRLVFCPLRETVSCPLSPRDSLGRLNGRSTAMRRVFHLAETYARSDAAILIQGETGTGKELLAEAMHALSPRAKNSFVVIDCGALAKGVIESELFGHAKGAFTGAASERMGAFEQAHGGTVFLDEIGELELHLQPKLLRALEKKEIRRLGSNTVRHVDVRIIAATNRNLEQEVREGRFREDLYYRLSIVRIELPPLRQRKEDIPLLVRCFLKELTGSDDLSALPDFERNMMLFRQHDWPGNARELRNVVEMAVRGAAGKIELGATFSLGRIREAEPDGALAAGETADIPFKLAKNHLVGQFEKEYIRRLLERNGGNISKAAREAQIERAYLQRLVRKHRLNPRRDAEAGE
jgi:transcriptional regulator with PAS, ATPase and Fis domain